MYELYYFQQFLRTRMFFKVVKSHWTSTIFNLAYTLISYWLHLRGGHYTSSVIYSKNSLLWSLTFSYTILHTFQTVCRCSLHINNMANYKYNIGIQSKKLGKSLARISFYLNFKPVWVLLSFIKNRLRHAFMFLYIYK